MAFTAQMLGRASGSNVTSLSLNTSGILAAGNRILVGIAITGNGFDSLTDSVGNTYNQAAGSQSGVSAFLFACQGNIRLPNGSTVTLAFATPFSATIVAVGITGLTSGIIDGSSAGQGFSTSPLVAVPSAVNNWNVGFVAVGGPSSDGFTQDPAFLNLGTFNTQTTTTLSAYAGAKQATAAGNVLYQPTLGVARDWAAFLVSMRP